MGEVKESGNSEIEDFAAHMNGHPRDLLKRFTAGNHRPTEFSETAEEAEEIELNLGLSLGGCFGVEPKDKKLVRSSSIAGFMTPMRDDDAVAPPPVAFSALMRTCSLPTEVEEERRNRKELQSLRRMEAKRKRSEKQRNFREAKDRASLERNCEEDKLAEGEARVPISLKPKVEGNIGYPGYLDSLAGKQQQYMVPNGFSPSVTPSFGLPPWAASARGGVVTRGIDTVANGKNNGLPSAAGSIAGGGGGGGAGGLQGFPPPSSQVSVGSQGSTSSGFSEFESRHGQESPASVQSLTENNEEKPIITLGTSSTDKSGKVAVVLTDNSSKKPKVVVENGTNEMGRNVMEEMPCVSTKGDGPNGRRIEGFLYRYRKGEEVRIVCVCHGSFLSPAEFVKHAGGGDVAHPLRHIVVNPTPSTFF